MNSLPLSSNVAHSYAKAFENSFGKEKICVHCLRRRKVETIFTWNITLTVNSNRRDGTRGKKKRGQKRRREERREGDDDAKENKRRGKLMREGEREGVKDREKSTRGRQSCKDAIHSNIEIRNDGRGEQKDLK